MLAFQIIYVFMGIFVAIYAYSSYKRTLHSFSYAFAVNVFPLALMPYMSMDEARLAGVPLAYIPIAAAGAVFILKSPYVSKVLQPLLLYMVLFVIFITFNAFYQRFLIGTIVYYLSWIFNFLLLLCVYSYFTKVDKSEAVEILTYFFKIVVLACFVGWFRYFSGLSPDANFMPMVNRNGTVVFLITVAPLLFFLYQIKKITITKLIAIWFVLFITLLFLQSRSGLIGFVFVTLLYFQRFNVKSILTSCLAALIFIFVLVSPVADKIGGRLIDAQNSVSTLSSGQQIEQGEKDYARYMLIKAAWTIFENNMLFGGGIGVPNYRAEFKENVNFFHRNSKSHNFYLSYLAELGLVGFTILFVILSHIYKSLAYLSSDYRAFRVSFLGLALMMTMNEYILLPELWFFYGMLGGMSFVVKGKT